MKTLKIADNQDLYLDKFLGTNILIASSAQSDVGVGELLIIPFDQLRAIRDDETNDNWEESGLSIEVEHPEHGLKTYSIFDYCAIGNLRQWCQDNNVTIELV